MRSLATNSIYYTAVLKMIYTMLQLQVKVVQYMTKLFATRDTYLCNWYQL